MDRRTLIQRLALLFPAAAIAPSLLASNDWIKSADWDGKVVIIGAGAAGLYAAYLLNEAGIDVTILEASALHGGRIRPLRGFSDFPIELGAEEVHGRRSVLYDLVKKAGGTFVKEDTSDFIFLDGKMQLEDALEDDPDVIKAIEAVDNIEDYEGVDIPVSEYVKKQGIPDRTKFIAEALIGNEAGTSNHRLGTAALAKEYGLWSSGNGNYSLNGQAHLDLLDTIFAPILDKVIYNTVVNAVDYDGAGVVVGAVNGQFYTADKVIVTTPIAILKDGDIKFTPSLPSKKIAAMQKIGMGAGMKIILKFSRRFWPANTGSLLSSGIVPEFWSTGTGRSKENNVLTAFVHGLPAEKLSKLDEGAVTVVLEQLDEMYGQETASSTLVDSYIMDWSKEPFIRGTYSFPTPNSFGARKTFAEPVKDKVYFAGEATHYEGHNSTVHGALETGQRTVKDILANIER